MNKKLMVFGILGLFAMGLVVAGYVVNTFVITTDVMEPFTVEYVILGDGSNYDASVHGTCADYDISGEPWFPGNDMDVGGLYPGEARKVCTRITNLGEGDLTYTFSGEVISGLGNLAECEYAFGNPSVSGTVDGLDTITDGALITVAGDATPATDCQITLTVERS